MKLHLSKKDKLKKLVDPNYDPTSSTFASGQSSNNGNRFNDVNIGERFKWAKKTEKQKQLGLSKSELKQIEKKRKKEALEELEKLNKQRAKRELEIQQRELLRNKAQRDLNLELIGDWKTRETMFSIDQDVRRAEIRIKENRAKPIDFLTMRLAVVNYKEDLASNNNNKESNFIIDMDFMANKDDMPYKIMYKLTLEEMSELKNDILIKMTSHFDINDTESIKYWENIMVICEFHLERLNAIHMNVSQSRVSYDVLVEIENMLERKSLEQLSELKRKVQNKINGKEPIDIDYWEQTLKSLLEHLKLFHKKFTTKYERLKANGKIDDQSTNDNKNKTKFNSNHRANSAHNKAEKHREEINSHKIIKYDPSMSPKMICNHKELTKNDLELLVVEENEDNQMRKEVISVGFVSKSNREMAIKKADNDLQVLLFERYKVDENNLEEELNEFDTKNKQSYSWQDKYKPRKPRYFNRVMTGYEWNKYNQTHYDKGDNPPPKVVQGYKFNIFYHDLISESGKPAPTPIYKLETDSSSKEHIIIRFIAGPPYEVFLTNLS